MSQDDTAEEPDEDLWEAFDDDETLPCSCSYVFVCILMPLLNGAVSGFIWPGYSLHFAEQGWSLVTGGVAITVGFALRVATQQFQLRAGYWLIVPLAAIHLTFAVLALIYQTSLWAIFAQIVVLLCLDPTCAIEGIAFDTFGASEVQARQATSTLLSVFTIAVASSCTIGGILYDLGGWTAVASYHSICQGLQLLLLCVQPPIRTSFTEFFFGDPSDDAAEVTATTATTATAAHEDHGPKGPKKLSFAVVPSAPMEVPMELPGAVASEELDEVGSETGHGSRRSADSELNALPKRVSMDPKNIGSRPHVRGSRASNPRASRASRASRSSRATRGSLASHASSPVRASAASAGTRETPSSSATGKSARTGRTAMTGRGSVVSAFSRVTALSEAGQDFSHHYLTSNLLQPEIVGASGKKRKVRLPVEDEDTEDGPEENPTPAKSGGIPSDIRLPASLIVLCSLCNNCSYSIEFSTFAIYFKEVHNWNEATLAGLAQTAGDLMAAIAMQVIPVFVSDNYDPDELDCFRRYLHYVTSMPYNLSLIVFTWVLFNGGLVTPILPLAITAQVLMGTTYVYSSKWTTDMNLFYSLGDPKLFLNLQVLCRNADAVGGTIGGVLGNFLYTVDPVGPFIFTCGLACVVFVIVTVGFCARLGFGDDIETAEEKRSRRLGKRRVSSWASAGRKSTTQNL